MKNKTVAAIIVMGLSSIVAQIVLLRELLVVFYGNELCIGIVLACWLIWEACGAGAAGLLIKKRIDPLNLFVIIQALISIFLPLSIMAVKMTRVMLGVGQGEIIGILPTMYVPFLLLAPVCLLFGLQFSSGCRLFAGYGKNHGQADDVSRVYGYEAVGWAIGGVLFTYLLSYILDNFTIALGISVINLLLAFILALGGKRKPAAFSLFILMVLFILFTVTPLRGRAYENMLKKQWEGHYKLVTSRDSVFGNVTVRERSGQYSFYQSGVLTSTSDDLLWNEELVHLPLLRFVNVRNALLVGGGVSGALDELLKYPGMEKVWYAEIDPLIIKLGRKYLNPDSLKDKRVSIINTDGRFFIKDLSSHPLLDCIIINLPDPSTAQLNRFYTLEFFREASEALSPSGIFSIGLSSSQDYISDELREFNGSIYKTLKEVFKNVIVIPGEHAFFVASQERCLAVTREFLSMNLSGLHGGTKYISPSYLHYRLNPERIKYVRNRIEDNDDLKINSDFHPIAYYHDIALWVSSYHIHAKKIFNWILQKATTNNFIIVILIMMVVAGIINRGGGVKKTCLFAVMVTGFVGMSCQVILISIFQVFYGYVYTKIGILTAGYMVGVVVGSRYMNRKKQVSSYKWLEITQLLMIIYLVSLPVVFSCFSLLKNHAAIFISAQVVFPILTLVMGCFTGGVFALANRIRFDGDSGQDIGLREAGVVYGADLAGAALGAMVSGVLLVPLVGIISACIILAVIVMGSLSLLLISR